MIQHDRARAIYKYALDHLAKEKCDDIYKNYTIHEKKYGDRAGIEDVIVSKRKFKYEEVRSNVKGLCKVNRIPRKNLDRALTLPYKSNFVLNSSLP